ncbi:hypothetical protein A9255_13225 [Xenorhabdus hominickii]|uniref:LysR family transcriptional regulator n=1 Tax=Xenorhabdus hominickii TaxID=351679 RepID=A0ABM6DU38_XENHO|nr:hypothetical protein A9255_13225 [Xenorhabdus hominickii]
MEGGCAIEILRQKDILIKNVVGNSLFVAALTSYLGVLFTTPISAAKIPPLNLPEFVLLQEKQHFFPIKTEEAYFCFSR